MEGGDEIIECVRSLFVGDEDIVNGEEMIVEDEEINVGEEVVREDYDEILRAVSFLFLPRREIGDEIVESVRNLFATVTDDQKMKLCLENPKCEAGCDSSFRINDLVVFLPLCKHIIRLRCYVRVRAVPMLENHKCPTHRVGMDFDFMLEYVDNMALLDYDSAVSDDDEFVQPPSPREELIEWVPCAICKQNFRSHEIVRMILHCCDYFHEGCLDEVFKNENEPNRCYICAAPYFRQDITEYSLPAYPHGDDYFFPIIDWTHSDMIRDMFSRLNFVQIQTDARGGRWAEDDGDNWDDFP